LDAFTYHTEYGLKPSFAKPSVPDDEGLHFITGVETPAYDKPSVPDETPAATRSYFTSSDLKRHDNVLTAKQAREEAPLGNKYCTA